MIPARIKDGAFFDQSLAMIGDHVWRPETLIQTIAAIVSLLIGLIAYRAMRPAVVQAIAGSGLPPYMRQIFNNLKNLLIFIVMLGVLFVLLQLARAFYPQIDFSVGDALMKLIVTWIAIRIVLQFIDNAFLRNLLALLILVIATLSIFGILGQTSTTLDAVGFNIGHFRFSALVIIKALLALFVLLYGAIFISGFLERRVMRTKSLSPSSKVLIIKIVRILLIVTAVMIAVSSSGVDMSVFAVFSGAVGLGVGFGLQKVASNLVSGILLLSDKSINPGDIIELENGTFGWVNRMAARYTEIVTRDNKSYLIPNEDFITQRIVNWSHGNRLIRLEIKFGVDYSSDPRSVIQIAQQAAAKPERVVDAPAPLCWITGFGDNALNFSLRFWIKDAEKGITNVKGEVFLAVWDLFQQHGIKIPYPQRVVHMRADTEL